MSTSNAPSDLFSAPAPPMRLLPAVLAIVLTIALAGCGGDGDSSGSVAEEATGPAAPDGSDEPAQPSTTETAVEPGGESAESTTSAVSPPAEPALLTDLVIDVAGAPRSYHLFLPAEPEGAPLVVLLHENGLDPDALLGLDGGAAPFAVWLDIAEREGLALVAPMGEGGGWNDCRSDAGTNPSTDDVAFIAAVIDEVAATHGLDTARVFSTGLSNGGHMSIRLAEEVPERIAGFAAVAAADSAASECASAQAAVPALFMNGSSDGLMPFDGGAMANGAMVFSSEETIARWVERNGAGEATVTEIDDLDLDDGSTVTVTRHAAGESGAPVVFYAVDGGGHNEPSISQQLDDLPPRRAPQNRDIEMAEEVWNFFAGLGS
jgi:polyhydroxybutyrate depolymerase